MNHESTHQIMRLIAITKCNCLTALIMMQFSVLTCRPGWWPPDWRRFAGCRRRSPPRLARRSPVPAELAPGLRSPARRQQHRVRPCCRCSEPRGSRARSAQTSGWTPGGTRGHDIHWYYLLHLSLIACTKHF